MISHWPWRVEPIRKGHERREFDCGVAEINEYLHRYARQSERLDLTRTFVAVRGGETKVWGFYTIRTGEIAFQDLKPEDTKRLPRYPIPVILLARLAVDRGVQGGGLGAFLLVDALARSHQASRSVGAHAVEVIAINEAAKRFYLRFGFRELIDDDLHLYLPTKTIASLVGDRDKK